MLERVVNEVREHLRREGVAVSVARLRDDTITIAHPLGDLQRHIEFCIRDDSDVEIAFVVPGKPGSPFELVMSGPIPEADEVVREALCLVGDLVTERMVLVWDRRLVPGGRRFLKASDLNPETLRHLAWVVSWRGTHDWNAAP